MDTKELEGILKKHKEWRDTNGESGERADLRWADLQGADLRGADLRGADLQGADLEVADFRDANLQDANLQDADLYGADLRDANLKGTQVIAFWLPGGAFGYHREGYIQIGCEGHSVAHWKKHYTDIGKKHGYNDELIEQYGNMIKGF